MKLFAAFLITTVSLLAYELKPVKINPYTYCFIGDTAPVSKENGGFISNICLLKSDNSIIALDAGPTYQFAKELDAMSIKLFKHSITHVIMSNYHDDRIIGASYFQDRNIPVYAAKGTSEAIAKNAMRFQRIPKEVGKEQYRGSYIPNRFSSIAVPMPFSNNIDIIKPSRASNSATDIAVYDKRTKFLFTGNIVFNDRAIGYAPDSDVSEWLVAIGKLKQLKAKNIMGGHGKQCDAKSYETTEKYLQAMKKQIPKLYDEGVGLDEIVKKTDFSNFKHLQHFNDLNGKNIYNYYMQVEQQ